MSDAEKRVKACPECNSSKVSRNSSRENETKDYRCRMCYAKFDEPGERELRQSANTLSGLAKRLNELDADAVGGGSGHTVSGPGLEGGATETAPGGRDA